MAWIDVALARCTHAPCGYSPADAPASEPTAYSALALMSHGRDAEANAALAWLASLQKPDGSIGVNAEHDSPCWPTALAAICWSAAEQHEPHNQNSRYHQNLRRALAWIAAAEGHKRERLEQFGHDPSLPGWPWVAETHAWVEPTALHVLALKSAGHRAHPRARSGVKLLIDRLLSTGGCNYGNTVVLGQELRPHVQPTGLTMLALAGEHDPTGRLEKSLAYLAGEVSATTPTSSLCFAVLGLAAHGRLSPDYVSWLEAASRRTSMRDRSPLKYALLALAAQGSDSLLVSLAQRAAGKPSRSTTAAAGATAGSAS